MLIDFHASLLMGDCDDFEISQSPLSCALSKGLNLGHLPPDPTVFGPHAISDDSYLLFFLRSLLGVWMWIRWSISSSLAADLTTVVLLLPSFGFIP
jgi:hypothetical protein